MKKMKDRLIHLCRIMGKYISLAINWKRPEKTVKDILLFANTSTMEEYLKNYLDAVGDNPDYRFYIFFGEGYSNRRSQMLEGTQLEGKSIKVIPEEWKLYFRRWDLIICADLEYPFLLKKGSIPLLHIKHGFSIISYDGGKHTYAYGSDCFDKNGAFLFDVMLEPDLYVAQAMWEEGEQFKKVIKYTGYDLSQRIEKESMRKEYYRQQLGITDDRCVVTFFGSWNKESLFHVLGEELFAKCEKLKDKYLFIFSIHPNEYRVYDKKVKPLGNLVEEQRKHGFLVRSPREDWLPYMMASDMIVADYTTMTALAILADKKVVLSDFPDSRIWEKSIYYEMKRRLPVIHTAAELEQKLKEAARGEKCKGLVLKCKEDLYVTYDQYQKTVKRITSEMMNK